MTKTACMTLKIFKEIGFKEGIAPSDKTVGFAYINQEFYSEAIKNLYAALEEEEQLGNKMEQGNWLATIGFDYYSQENYH